MVAAFAFAGARAVAEFDKDVAQGVDAAALLLLVVKIVLLHELLSPAAAWVTSNQWPSDLLLPGRRAVNIQATSLATVVTKV